MPSILTEIISDIADLIRDHLQSISVGLVATFLMVYGYKINSMFRKQTKSMHFILRYLLFVLLCSAGYGFLSSQATKWLKYSLTKLGDTQMVLTVCGAFFVMAFLARKGKEI